MIGRLLWGVLAAGAFAAVPAEAGVLTVTGGTDNPGDCTFTCVATYQQVYAPSDFAGPIDITAVDFVAGDSGTWAAQSTYTLTIGISPTGVNNLSPTFASNITGATTFGTTTYTGTFTNGQLFGFTGSYDYNPSEGALIVQVTYTGSDSTPPFGPDVYFTANAGGAFSRDYSFTEGATSGGPGSNYGDETVFSYGTYSSAPEPSTVALLASAFAAAGLIRRRHRRDTPAV